jgi:hypothetical protein
MSGKRNKNAGSGWEREIAQLLRSIGYLHVITTRQGSRLRDSQKIDIMNADEDRNGRFPYNIQAKNVKGHLPYGKVIAELPKVEGVTNIIFHKMTQKVNNRFVCKDKFAILYLDDFIEIMKKLKSNETV